jgi:hypothetical protein
MCDNVEAISAAPLSPAAESSRGYCILPPSGGPDEKRNAMSEPYAKTQSSHSISGSAPKNNMYSLLWSIA